MRKNPKIWLLAIGNNIPSFFTYAYSFTSLLLFYHLTNSYIISGVFSTASIIVSRITMIILIPYCKGVSPRRLVISGLVGLIGVSCIGIMLYPTNKDSIWYFGLILLSFNVFQEILDSYIRPLIPLIVRKEDLFQTNSFMGVTRSFMLIIAPLFGNYVANEKINILYTGMILFSSINIILFSKSIFKQAIQEEQKSKKFIQEWMKSIQLIKGNAEIAFCLLVAILINLAFAGMNTTGVLAIGKGNDGATLIRIMLGLGSFIGILAVMKIKTENNYQKLLNISMIGILISLIGCYFSASTIYIEAVTMFFLFAFIMFVMNATGTVLQLLVPQEEIPSIYEIRSSIIAIVVPVSTILTGWILEVTTVFVYFFIIFILVLCLTVIRFYYVYLQQTNHSNDKII